MTVSRLTNDFKLGPFTQPGRNLFAYHKRIVRDQHADAAAAQAGRVDRHRQG
ncbi:MAG: hypothetical protein QM811_28375 [Pirellulales bacterium]